MKVAVIGGGLSGLALCWHLLQFPGCQVTVFEKKRIGAGASGVSTGLLHPYAGEQARRSWRAKEGIQATLALLNVAEDALGQKIILSNGIIRILEDEAHREQFTHHFSSYQDVEKWGEKQFFVSSGMTIDVPKYLQGLWSACSVKGAQLVIQEIASLKDLEDFDAVAIAAGAGSPAFEEVTLKVDLIKGQVLTYQLPFDVPCSHSLVAKGYISLSPLSNVFYLGSTYERDFHTEAPCQEKALLELAPKLNFFFPQIKEYSLLECRSGVRVARRGHYYPLVRRLNKKCWMMTGLGSRGLLYHAYIAENLAQAICTDDETLLYKELIIR